MSDDTVQQLERLEALLARGALTGEEFAAAKARLLAAPEPLLGQESLPGPLDIPPPPTVFPPPREKPLHESPSASTEPPVFAGAGPDDATIFDSSSTAGSDTSRWDDTILTPGEGLAGAAASPPRVAVAAVPPSSLLPPRYPVTYDVAYPEHLSRWKTLLRFPLLVPVWLFLYLVQSALWSLLSIGWATVFLKKKYPSWAFAGAAGATSYGARVIAYTLLQTDRFPSFDRESSPVTLEFDPPPSGQLSRWRVLFWKSALLIPHLVVLGALQMALFVVTILAWFGIVFSGHYPRGMFPFATGVMRWHYRVFSYFASFNDRYPPYSLSAEAGPAGKQAVTWSAIGGLASAAGLTTLVIVGVIVGSRPDVVYADYAALKHGQPTSTVYYDTTDGGEIGVSLVRVTDPGDGLARILTPTSLERVVVFEWSIVNFSGSSRRIPVDAAWLKAEAGGKKHDYDPQILTIEGRTAPGAVESGDTVTMRAVFVIPKTAEPLELHFEAGFTGLGGIRYEFE